MIVKGLIAWAVLAFLAWAICRGGDCDDDMCEIQILCNNNEINLK